MVNILLIEDNLGDARLIQESLSECKIYNKITHIDNGVKALEYLKKQTIQNIPDLILLDLNLPGMSGQEILNEIKNDDLTKNIPVCILTASSADLDIVKSYNLHANCYIIKPLDLDQFIIVVNSIAEFWFTIVKLPTI